MEKFLVQELVPSKNCNEKVLEWNSTIYLPSIRWNPLKSADPYVFAKGFCEMAGEENSACELAIAKTIQMLVKLDSANKNHQYRNLHQVMDVLQNIGGYGRTITKRFTDMKTETKDEAKENFAITSYFLTEYFSENGQHKMYEQSRARICLEQINQDPILSKILNCNPKDPEYSGMIDLSSRIAVPYDCDINFVMKTLRSLCNI